jgi:heavy metal sensor kinase
MIALPIRLRLAAWYFAVLAVVLSLFGLSAYFEMRQSIRRTVDEELEARAKGVSQLIERTIKRGDRDALPEGLREHTELRAGGALLQVSDARGEWVYRSSVMSDYGVPRAPIVPLKSRETEISGIPLLEFGRAGERPRPRANDFQAPNMPLRVWNEEVQAAREPYIVQVAAEMDDYYGALRHFALLLFISIPLLLGCAAGGGYWISSRALAPVDQIAQTARTISAQNLSSRLVVPNTRDELRRLSETLNGMLERLESAFKRITQFTADASHELRTPVAVMRTQTELSLRRARSEEEYRDTISQVHAELERTSALIEQLMYLARADCGAETLHFAPTNVADVLSEACRQGGALAEAKQVEFQEDISAEPVWMEGDASSLRRLFLILIDNAVKYTPANGRIDVSLRKSDGFAVAEVRDTGIGIAASDLPSVFERFYRADKARSRESGGVGLGLSIGRWIAEAHSGMIEVESSLGIGSVFRVRLPLANGERLGKKAAPVNATANPVS